jgi:hypothetical protein
MLRAAAGLREVRVRALYHWVRVAVAQLALQGGVAWLCALVVLGSPFRFVLILDIPQHVFSYIGFAPKMIDGTAPVTKFGDTIKIILTDFLRRES